MFHMDIAIIDRDIAHVAMVVHVCCKRPFQIFFRCTLQVCSFICCICFTRMLQEYVRNILAVSVLR